MIEKTYTVYIHTNKINNKKYIGVTSNTIEKRAGRNGIRYKRCIAFYNAINKYGWNNFKHEIIKSNLTKEEAGICEKCLIRIYDTRNPKYGYNISEGGYTGYKITDETRKKISDAKTGVPSPKLGKHYSLSEESKKSFREKVGIKIVQLDKKSGELIRVFETIKDVEQYGFYARNVTRVCKGERQTAYKYRWMFYDDYINNH